MSGEKLDKEAKKAAMKEEAKQKGITYEELKKEQKKKKKREADALESEEHKTEIKRMRSWSKDFGGEKAAPTSTTTTTTKTTTPTSTLDEPSTKRRRTRSMDVAEENQAVILEAKQLSPNEWRKEHTLTLRGHGKSVLAPGEDFVAPYIEFNDSPYSSKIKLTLTGAGFARPTPIQAQAWPLAVQAKDLICVAKTGSGYVKKKFLGCFVIHWLWFRFWCRLGLFDTGENEKNTQMDNGLLTFIFFLIYIILPFNYTHTHTEKHVVSCFPSFTNFNKTIPIHLLIVVLRQVVDEEHPVVLHSVVVVVVKVLPPSPCYWSWPPRGNSVFKFWKKPKNLVVPLESAVCVVMAVHLNIHKFKPWIGVSIVSLLHRDVSMI
jgi:hypothetical protein